MTADSPEAVAHHISPATNLESWIFCLGDSDKIQVPATALNHTIFTMSNKQLRLLSQSDTSLPAYAQKASCAVLFYGRLYNREEFSNAQPAVNDAQLILDAYLQRGQEVIHKIKGIFALILYDHTRDLLLSFRDPLGVQPLFYADAPNQILLSPSIDPLIDYPGVSRELNRARMVDHLCNRWLKPEETYYAAVKRILPGHALRKTKGSCEQFRYWDPVPAGADPVWVKDDALERFDSLLEHAVWQSQEIGPTGIFLSGGLDSVSVASVAVDLARQNNKPVPLALSLIFPHPDCDEADVQKAVAADLGLTHLMMPFEEAIGQQGIVRSALTMSSEWQSPMLSPWMPGYYHLASEAQKRGCKVILTGGGGDEWLTVTPAYAADLIRRLDFSGLYQLSKNLLRSYRLSRSSMLRFIVWQSGLRSILSENAAVLFPNQIRKRRKRKIRQTTHSWVAPDVALHRQIDQRIDDFVDSMLPRQKPGRRYKYYFSNLPEMFLRPFASMVMEEQFELGRRVGLRVLSPYYDADLVDLLLRIPPEILQTGGREKGLVRQTVARRFPELKFERQRKVTAARFTQSILLDEGPKIWKEIGGLKCLSNLGIVYSNEMDSVLGASVGSNYLPTNYRIWDLLSLELWARPRS